MMDYATSTVGTVTQPLISMERPKKPKMLVVDDEPDNLDLLYRTFRRDFQVLKAESGVRALDVLAAEGEVAVIISDQRMPEMKGTEFLSRTVPQFPDTMRIILTGFTDVEDLVEAINSGQVYKYITKPWDPNELKVVVQRAAETYELLKQRTEELQRSQAQTALLSTIVQVAQQSNGPDACLEPVAIAFGQAFYADSVTLQLVQNGQLSHSLGAVGSAGDSLESDPMVKTALSSEQMQVVMNMAADPDLANVEHYKAGTIQAQAVVPIIYRSQVLAILALQWHQVHTLRDDEQMLLQLSAQQVALALVCTQYAKSAA